MKLQLTNPLVFFDLETTGLNLASDRIVEISYYKVFPDGSAKGETFRVNPEMHICDEASAVHGIHDEDVAGCKTFKEIAPYIAEVIADADLAGYNSNRFDIPLLAEEFIRAGLNVELKRKKMIDVFTIFQKNEPRNLTAAYHFYCNKNLEDAHSANADTMATYEVLMAQLERYDIPVSVPQLADYTEEGARYADFARRIAYDNEGVEIFNFGQHKGKRVADVFRLNPGYYRWIMDGDFPQYTKNVFMRIYLDTRK